jgi:tripeptide aminopeptidase
MKNLIEKFDRTLNWQSLPDIAHWVVEKALTIQQIPAPTFHERSRAEYVSGQFTELGLKEVDIDPMGNVYGRYAGSSSSQPGVMIVAHTDTVFSGDTDLTTRRDGNFVYGPGLGDNSMGVAGMLGLIEMLRREEITPARDLWFAATTREEGLGNLDGMRAAYERLKSCVNTVVNIEGLAFGHIYHAGISVRRLKITAKTGGGHSWLHFGRESAVHGILRLGAKIDAIKPPNHPRTTYNIGIVEGGQSINSIASSASLWLDMRSESKESLDALEREVSGFIDAMRSDEMTFSVEVVGDRPAGYLDPNHPLVQGAMAALAQVGVRGTLETGSTDGNISLADNVPTVTVGITRGGNAHRLDEYIETTPVASGMQQLVMLVLAAASS